MAKKERIARHTDKELRVLQARGKDKSDWARAAAMTHAQIEAAVTDDPDEAKMEIDWSQASVTLPESKAILNMRVDRAVLDYFRGQGAGYQTKINAVLRSYVDHQMQRAKR